MAYIKGYALWASVQEPNTTFDPAWKIELVISEEDASALKKQGFNVKNASQVKGAEEFGEFVVSFKQPCTSKSTGEPNPAPVVVDKDAKPFTDLVGNGSFVNVEYFPSAWSFAGKKGTKGYLRGVQVIHHVPYQSETGFKPISDNNEEF